MTDNGSNSEQFDNMLFSLTEHHGVGHDGVNRFLENIFSFLARRTDFYTLGEAAAENLVVTILRKFEKEADDQDMDTDGDPLGKRKAEVQGRGNKRRRMSPRPAKKPWNKEDAEKAFAAEAAICPKPSRMVFIKFPDKPVTKETVSAMHHAIERVQFPTNVKERYCIAAIRAGHDVEKVVEELNQKPFHDLGNLMAEMKKSGAREVTKCEEIDPYTVYLGNVSSKVTVREIKEKFPRAVHIDLGNSHPWKYTRPAFLNYDNVDDAIAEINASENVEFHSRPVFARFRRNRLTEGEPMA